MRPGHRWIFESRQAWGRGTLFRLWRRVASWSASSRKKSGAQHRGSGKRFECGVHGALTAFSCFCMGAGLVILFIIPEVMTAFTVLSTISAILFIFAWAMIVVAYIRYRSIDPQLHIASRFKMPGGLLMPWLVLAFFVFVIMLLALEPDTLHAMLCMPIWFAILAVAYRRKRQAPQLASETSIS
ncbi:hypothetical protein [Pseudomonas putida]|uniref:hypothetical protein n=1 Tax=Pseudomonas putida TaxID=303 RepID=UPI002DBBBA97|nr:hypothetical protein [Pseudomonas putida]WRW05864.1 hypothetical protein VPZ82_10755 [Pseudomonas putida]